MWSPSLFLFFRWCSSSTLIPSPLNSYSSLNPQLPSIPPLNFIPPSSSFFPSSLLSSLPSPLLLPPSSLPTSSLLPPPSLFLSFLLHLQNHYVWCWKGQSSPLSPQSHRPQTDTSHPTWPAGTVPEGFEWVLGGWWWHRMMFVHAFHLASFPGSPCTRMKNTFPYCKQWKAGQDFGTRPHFTLCEAYLPMYVHVLHCMYRQWAHYGLGTNSCS